MISVTNFIDSTGPSCQIPISRTVNINFRFISSQSLLGGQYQRINLTLTAHFNASQTGKEQNIGTRLLHKTVVHQFQLLRIDVYPSHRIFCFVRYSLTRFRKNLLGYTAINDLLTIGKITPGGNHTCRTHSPQCPCRLNQQHFRSVTCSGNSRCTSCRTSPYDYYIVEVVQINPPP